MSIDFNDIIKNFGGFKEKIEHLQERMKSMRISGEAGAGMVRVTLDGDGVVKRVEIDESLFADGAKDIIEELVVSAVNDAQKKVREAMAHEMKSVTGGFMPPGMERLFGL